MINMLGSFLTEEVTYKSHIPALQRKVLLNALLVIVMVVIAVFVVYDYFFTSNTVFVLIESLTLLSFGFAFVSLRYYDNYDSAVTLSVITLFLFTFFFVSVNNSRDFGLIWCVFFPIFAVFTMGHRAGMPLVALFYGIFLFLAYKGIGSWQAGQWNELAFFRFAVALSILIYVTYVIELSQETVYKKVKNLMDKEQRHMRELEKLSVTDGMTSLYNKRFFNQVLQREFYRARRHNLYFGFCILDVDFFKQYNDRYGHEKGDSVLVAIAELMQNHLRRHEDFVFRLGGEEFGAIVKSDSKEKIAEHIRALKSSVEAMHIEHAGNRVSPFVSVSIGLLLTNTFDEATLHSLYASADKALYEAKESGRNQVVVKEA
ncbi:MAG: GGDEF domain-containing protein [Campylobacterota bacterium]